MDVIGNIRIVPWADHYADDFISLSVEWLEKYVSVEPADLKILNHPHEEILDRGGMIFFALDGEKPIGTVAMIPAAEGVFELAKLAVTESYKGRHISDLLMKSALAFAVDRGASVVLLYTNRKLIPAIRLYEKYGFAEVELVDNKYLESDMKMVREII